jgi:hypothetical protein
MLIRRKVGKLINGEIAFGFFVAGIFWIAAYALLASYTPTTAEKEYCYQAAAKSGHDTQECESFWERTTSDPIALFTLVLSFATVGLWAATIWGIRSQKSDTRILQRAYISVKPGGVTPYSGEDDRLACNIVIYNAGNLPAHNVLWGIEATYSADPLADCFDVSKIHTVGKIVLPPKGEFRKGAKPTTKSSFDRWLADAKPDKAWLYIWGRISYHDGFVGGRYIDFCHRYNLRGAQGYTIPENNGRYHEYGNRTDEG